MQDSEKARLCAEKWLRQAGQLLLSMQQGDLSIEAKEDATPVTAIDRAVERLLRSLIMAEFPDHGIRGEEFPPYRPEAPCQWVIDPVDGTRALMGGVPVFTTLLALVEHGKPVLGAIYQPITRDLWLGVAGQGTTLNRQPVQARACISLGQAMFSSSSSLLFEPEEKPKMEQIYQSVRDCQFGADAYAYGRIASGHIDLVVESGLKPHDFMALLPVLQGAGATVTDWQGRPITMESNGKICAAGDVRVHEEALEILAG
jgi:inositol-phosphate phosphatase/L-galactose 1-phosphate phosphatase/histidinol-phosphatase